MLATVAQLEARLGEPPGSLAGEDLARATAALEDASVLVAAYGSRTWTIETVPDTARVVVLRLARRFWDNPEGLNYEALGDHTVSRAAASTFLTPEERALVAGAAGSAGHAGVYSVGTPGVWS
ncbi:hypothetical protein SMC26_39425 [Actinomadura fulvescens]|uniref:Head-to-tail adaptor n=1 Tax=Actinomadura fulvescens TaxID=46160 RepID=A0ABN3PZK3_9ACTN